MKFQSTQKWNVSSDTYRLNVVSCGHCNYIEFFLSTGWKINVIWNKKKHAKWIAKHANINSIPAQLPCTDNVEVEVRVDESSSASGSVTEHSMDPPVLGLFIEQDVSSDQYNPACMDDASTPRSASGVPAENNVGIEV